MLDFHRQPKLGGLLTFDDFERWADLNLRYLRSIDYAKTPTYHSLAGQLAKSDDATRRTLGDGYRRWVDLLEQSFQRMKDRGVLVTSVDPRALALVKARAPLVSPTGRIGHSRMPRDSSSTICGPSPSTPTNELRAERGEPAVGGHATSVMAMTTATRDSPRRVWSRVGASCRARPS